MCIRGQCIKCMKTSTYCIAPCWSAKDITGATEPRESRSTLALFGAEIELDEGLQRMVQAEWKVVRIQTDDTDSRALYRQPPDCFYLFGKEERPTRH
jgi:hypothetical protein